MSTVAEDQALYASTLRLLRIRISNTEPCSWWCCKNGTAVQREAALLLLDAALYEYDRQRQSAETDFYSGARHAQAFAEQILNNYEPSMHRRADSIDWDALKFRRKQMYREFFRRWQP